MPLDEHSAQIEHIGSPIIRAHAQRIGSLVHAAKIVEILVNKLNELEGAGLAAPQIGLPYRVFVLQVRKTDMFPEREESPLYTMINPEIEILSTEELMDYEGCFSVPGYAGLVPRYKSLKATWSDPDGNERKEIFEGYRARVIQHELDHLNGMVYLDRMKDMLSFSTRENYMRYIREV
ncbi:MAG: peptide deformylase [Candidatus Obscuribacterales bacterium]|nr:peptide deformylase [Candidatus Obscuribacterales bacterium]